jgi:ergothioneine biosynthesis protein EgtB
MALQFAVIRPDTSLSTLIDHYRRVRDRSLDLCRTMQTEDFVIQTMPSVSPTKWHLAHTTWFFEQFVLIPHQHNYRVYDENYHYLFNSYYHTKGRIFSRSQRGILSRPTVDEIHAYREHVDEQIQSLVKQNDDQMLSFLIELGLNHEEQHQELMLTDIKHVFSVNPLQPALLEHHAPAAVAHGTDYSFIAYEGGNRKIGATGNEFTFDNEIPRHEVYIAPFHLADRPVNNREFKAFIDDGGYRRSDLWLSDGWAWISEHNIDRPLYWSDNHTTEFTLSGTKHIDAEAPVCHISFYEADAFARWADARLPTEAEWEIVASTMPVQGNFMDDQIWHPVSAANSAGDEPRQMFGDVWEWTASSYSPYPGFEPMDGSLGEYNGKFMCNQMVCRGGSCATPADHIRASYRNFFYPDDRWQFFGVRLARNA